MSNTVQDLRYCTIKFTELLKIVFKTIYFIQFTSQSVNHRTFHLQVNDSEPFELSCKVAGNPRPSVTWFLGEEEIQSESGISMLYEGWSGDISIRDVNHIIYLIRNSRRHFFI